MVLRMLSADGTVSIVTVEVLLLSVASWWCWLWCVTEAKMNDDMQMKPGKVILLDCHMQITYSVQWSSKCPGQHTDNNYH